jgi:hypothetical protein
MGKTMKKKLLIIVGTVAVGAVLLGLSLPTIVHELGLHPTYEGETYDLKGLRALVITTSHGVLNAPGETEGDPTGVMASEFTHPYYGFLDAGMEVDMANVRGGPIPIDPQTCSSTTSTSPSTTRSSSPEAGGPRSTSATPTCSVRR